MTARPRIGLTTYGRNQDNRFTLPAEYVDSIRRAGGTPVVLPPGEGDLQGWFDLIDGLVLPGGGDILPAAYGGRPHPENYKMDRDRDADELAMARHAVGSRLPLLAICRGMQILNVAFGGSLIAHVPDAIGESVPHRSPTRAPVPHRVVVDPESRLAAALGAACVTVSSWHHQAIERLAPGFVPVARSDDGLIEAIERPDSGFLLAVQWHPELTAASDPAQQRLFEALVRAATRA